MRGGRPPGDGGAEVRDGNWSGPTKILDVTMAVAGLRRRLTRAADASVRSGSRLRVATPRGRGYRLELSRAPRHAGSDQAAGLAGRRPVQSTPGRARPRS
ncbi:hypothetical protein ACE1SV_65210 [Streptomyces sennicomposti]